ncbi:unnamed protein product, partial [Closterium sp. NIES-54]
MQVHCSTSMHFPVAVFPTPLVRILAPLLTTSRLDQRQNCALSIAAILHTE